MLLLTEINCPLYISFFRRRAAKPARKNPIPNGGEKSQRSIRDWCTKASPEDVSAADSARRPPRREATKRGSEDTQAKSNSSKKNKMQNGVEATEVFDILYCKND